MKVIGIIVTAILSIAALIALAFVLELGGLKWDMYFGPKHAAVEREVFKQTRQFTEGKIQELTKHRLEYFRTKDDLDKRAIASTVRHAFADFDRSSLKNPELESFLKHMIDGTTPIAP